ncbi:MAG TPA: Spy/CpxP family protein refolding chaperone [Aquabacterium sp.]|nr:Spy/CpxP family protein refolding chaperone [Aquabacterium sp.]HQC94424.1 Spy/CpxP family protein refolding chaperone [Aquabacterium sp.]
MKTWIKRTLIATASAALLLGGLTACGGHGGRHGPDGGWNEARITEMRGKAIERIGSKLELDAAQKAKLETLADALLAQRQALRGGMSGSPRDALKPLIAGEKFDRAQAQALLQAKTAAVQGQGPKVVEALADFYDSLKPAQQAQVRAMLDKRGHGWSHWNGRG